MAQKSHHIFIAVFTDPCDTAKQVLQGWIHLRLPSCRPGFESHPHHLCFYNLLYNFWYICYVKRTKINKKRRVWSLFSKFYSTDPERERERESENVSCDMWSIFQRFVVLWLLLIGNIFLFFVSPVRSSPLRQWNFVLPTYLPTRCKKCFLAFSGSENLHFVKHSWLAQLIGVGSCLWRQWQTVCFTHYLDIPSLWNAA